MQWISDWSLLSSEIWLLISLLLSERAVQFMDLSYYSCQYKPLTLTDTPNILHCKIVLKFPFYYLSSVYSVNVINELSRSKMRNTGNEPMNIKNLVIRTYLAARFFSGFSQLSNWSVQYVFFWMKDSAVQVFKIAYAALVKRQHVFRSYSCPQVSFKILHIPNKCWSE